MASSSTNNVHHPDANRHAPSIDEMTATLASIFDQHDCETLVAALRENDDNLEATIDCIISKSTQIEAQSSTVKSNRGRQRSPEIPSSNKKTRPSSHLASWLYPDEHRVKHSTGSTSMHALDASGALAKARKTVKDANLCHRPSSTRSSSETLGGAALQSESSTLRSLNDVLGRAPQSLSPKPTKRPNLSPLHLSTPKQVSEHLPCCSLLYGILPKDLALQLYLNMIKDCNGRGETKTPWTRNRWWLADREVESPHLTAFFISKPTASESLIHDYNESAQFWFVGKPLEAEARPRFFLDEMGQAKIIVESIVNQLLDNVPEVLLKAQRDITSNPVKRYDHEWDGPWRANVAASNCYRGSKENVGWHADQLTYLGPYPTIASLSLGTTRQFRLRPVNNILQPEAENLRTYSMSLPHNSLLVMHGGCQERYKHCIPPQTSVDIFKDPYKPTDSYIERINITFRFYRPDFRPSRSLHTPTTLPPFPVSSSAPVNMVPPLVSSTTPKCHCGVPAILRADQKGKVAASRHRSTGSSHQANQPSEPDFQFFWHCQAGQQNSGKSCKFFQVLDLQLENRGPCIGDRNKPDQ